MTQGGFGIDFQMDGGAGLVAVVKIRDAKFPKQTSTIVDATTHDSPSGYYEAIAVGLRRLEPFELTLNWDDTQATHARVLTVFAADAPVACSIADPDGDETIAFSAFVESIERDGPLNGLYTARVRIHPTGAPTIT